MVHPWWCEAFRTMNRVSVYEKGENREMESLLGASPGLGLGSGHMVNLCEHPQAPLLGNKPKRLSGLDQKVRGQVRVLLT